MARDFVQRLHQPTIAPVAVTDPRDLCEYCGRPLDDDRRSNTRFCGALCRSRKHKHRTLTGHARNHSGKE